MSYSGIKVEEIEFPYDGAYAGSPEGPREARTSCATIRLDGNEVAVSPSQALRLDVVDPMESSLPLGGLPRLEILVMGKEAFFERQWRAIAKKAFDIDAKMRASQGWPLPAGQEAIKGPA